MFYITITASDNEIQLIETIKSIPVYGFSKLVPFLYVDRKQVF